MRHIILKSIVLVLLFSIIIYWIINFRKFSNGMQVITTVTFAILFSVAILIIAFGSNKKNKSDTKLTEKNEDKIFSGCKMAVEKFYKKRNFFQRRMVYDKPWFLICSPDDIKLEEILDVNGTNYYLKYPVEELTENKGNPVRWRFSSDSVWIEFVENIIDNKCSGQWDALIDSLIRIRKKKPLDGIVVVFDITKIGKIENDDIQVISAKTRNRICNLILKTGLVVPSYVVFHNINEITGFPETIEDNEICEIMGKTFDYSCGNDLSTQTFKREYNLILKLLSKRHIEKIHQERNENKRLLLSQFVFHFFCLQNKLELLVNETFGKYRVDLPLLLNGFYFTACYQKKINEKCDNQKKIFNSTDSFKSSSQEEENEKSFCSINILPLLKDILPKQRTIEIKTPLEYEKNRIKKRRIFITAFMMLITLAICVTLLYIRVGNIIDEIEKEIITISETNDNLTDLFRVIDIYQQRLTYLQKIKNTGILRRLVFKIYKGDKLLEVIKKETINLTRENLIMPAIEYVEREIQNLSKKETVLSIKENERLSKTLKFYLTFSKKGLKAKKGDIEEQKRMLYEKVTKIILMNDMEKQWNIEKIVQKSIELYLESTQKGESQVEYVKTQIVSDARERLSKLPSIDIIYEDLISKMDNAYSDITLQQILGKFDSVLKTDQTISTLFTGTGFYDVVDVISDYDHNLPEDDKLNNDSSSKYSILEKRENIRKKLLNKYIGDYKKHWIEFIKSVEVDSTESITMANQVLQKIVNDNFGIDSFFTNICNTALIKKKNDGLLDKKTNLVIALTDKIKYGKESKEYLKKITRIDSRADDINGYFNHLERLSKSESAPDNYYSIYKNSIVELSELIKQLQKEGGYYVCSDIADPNGPLFIALDAAKKVLNGMPEEMSEAIAGILIDPLEYTGNNLTDIMKGEINKLWQSEVYSLYKTEIKCRYPFDINGEDASFEGVVDFFRPKTGILWGYYGRILSSHIIQKDREWCVKQQELIRLKFNEQILVALRNAEKVTDVLFKKDGTQRVTGIVLTPENSCSFKGFILENENSFEISNGSKSVIWPDESVNATGIRIMKSEDDFQELHFNGPWSTVRLMQSARKQIINNRTYIGKWQINFYNIYSVFYKAKVSLSSDFHPFQESLFERINFPEILINALEQNEWK